MEECINLLIGDDGVARPAVPVTVYVEDETQAENLMQFLMNNHAAVSAAISGESKMQNAGTHMCIKRTIDGKEVEIDLTHDELIQAHEMIELEFTIEKVNEVLDLFGAQDEKSFLFYTGVSLEDFKPHIEEIAKRYIANCKKFGTPRNEEDEIEYLIRDAINVMLGGEPEDEDDEDE